MSHPAPSFLSPKELAMAVGVSESSIRRWVDDGQLQLSRTAGGHRRIPLAESVRFVREMGLSLARPEILGLGDLRELRPFAGDASDEDRLYESLHAGDRITARGLILSWFLNGRGIAALFDGPIRGSLHRLGELWKHDLHGILIEHRATEICLAAIAALRELLPAPSAQAPLALGAAPEGDPYLLPTMMAATVLADSGFRDVNFGANTPVTLLGSQARQQNARLVWLSISAPQDAKSLRRDIRKLAEELSPANIPLVIGGRLQRDYAPRGLQNIYLADSMEALAAYARGILQPVIQHASEEIAAASEHK